MTIKLAVVGLGYWGPNLVRAFNEVSEIGVSALVDADANRLEFAGKIAPHAKRFTSIENMLGEDLNAVVLATPAETHFELGMKVLESGKDLFVEKPITLNYDEAIQLSEFAKKNERVLMVGHLLLYHPAYIETERRLREGGLGALRYLYARRVNLGIVRSCENALWSLAPHDIAVSNWLVGKNAEAVQAVGFSFLQKEIEDVVFYTIKYQDGIIFHGHVSWLDPQKVRELSVIGTEKMAVIDDTAATEKLKIFDRKIETQRQQFTTYGQFLSIQTGDILLPRLPSAEPLKNEAKHFIECVRDRKKPLSDGFSGAKVIKILNALTESLKGKGGWVEI
ncbi:TPA: hypothetical protein DEF17_03195 [bacterium]|nr:MAG: hypothetical protein AUJ18_10895 [Candidatus Hydrogenedentes bacterium CG1_02_42_14]PIU47756.1 MAG: hypothetical protein COS94_05775 [Candidatus Hydrogenedentes bacterium CG07_land_8_20_14_0_80_42_17]HBW46925.1 hypothetical protein [bacterium]